MTDIVNIRMERMKRGLIRPVVRGKDPPRVIYFPKPKQPPFLLLEFKR